MKPGKVAEEGGSTNTKAHLEEEHTFSPVLCEPKRIFGWLRLEARFVGDEGLRVPQTVPGVLE
jgi:hypothetical protein